MSYDINVWSIERPDLPTSLPSAEAWELVDDFVTYTTRDWQITISPPMQVMDEDVPDGVSEMLIGIGYLTELSLRPFDAGTRSRKFLGQVAMSIAKRYKAVVEDPQEETVRTPGGVTRFASGRNEKEERFSILRLCYWFINPRVDDSEVWPALIKYFKRRLPEALPRRYGRSEPPEHRYDQTGDDHLLAYMDDHKYDLTIWYPHRPVTDLYLHLEPDLGFVFDRWHKQRMLKVNRFTIGIDAAALKQPGWPLHCERLWRDLAILLRPFYGDVRILDNFIRGRATYWIDGWSESHPAGGPSWSGIPSRVGQAVVVGEPYLSLWPGLEAFGEMKDGLRFVSTDNWLAKRDATEIVGEVPRDIAKRGEVWLERVLGFFTGRSV